MAVRNTVSPQGFCHWDFQVTEIKEEGMSYAHTLLYTSITSISSLWKTIKLLETTLQEAAVTIYSLVAGRETEARTFGTQTKY